MPVLWLHHRVEQNGKNRRVNMDDGKKEKAFYLSFREYFNI